MKTNPAIKEVNSIKNQETSYLTVKDLSEYLGSAFSISTIHKMSAKRQIPFFKPGGKILLFRKSEIDTWLEKSRHRSIEAIKANAELQIQKNF